VIGTRIGPGSAKQSRSIQSMSNAAWKACAAPVRSRK
jgi:hypothetical protein